MTPGNVDENVAVDDVAGHPCVRTGGLLRDYISELPSTDQRLLLPLSGMHGKKCTNLTFTPFTSKSLIRIIALVSESRRDDHQTKSRNMFSIKVSTRASMHHLASDTKLAFRTAGQDKPNETN